MSAERPSAREEEGYQTADQVEASQQYTREFFVEQARESLKAADQSTDVPAGKGSPYDRPALGFYKQGAPQEVAPLDPEAAEPQAISPSDPEQSELRDSA